MAIRHLITWLIYFVCCVCISLGEYVLFNSSYCSYSTKLLIVDFFLSKMSFCLYLVENKRKKEWCFLASWIYYYQWFIYLSQQQCFLRCIQYYSFIYFCDSRMLCYTFLWCIFTKILSFALSWTLLLLFQLILWKCRWIQVLFVLFPSSNGSAIAVRLLFLHLARFNYSYQKWNECFLYLCRGYYSTQFE